MSLSHCLTHYLCVKYIYYLPCLCLSDMDKKFFIYEKTRLADPKSVEFPQLSQNSILKGLREAFGRLITKWRGFREIFPMKTSQRLQAPTIRCLFINKF